MAKKAKKTKKDQDDNLITMSDGPSLSEETLVEYEKIKDKNPKDMTPTEWNLFYKVTTTISEGPDTDGGLKAYTLRNDIDFKPFVKILIPTLKALHKYDKYLQLTRQSDMGWREKKNIASGLIQGYKDIKKA